MKLRIVMMAMVMLLVFAMASACTGTSNGGTPTPTATATATPAPATTAVPTQTQGPSLSPGPTVTMPPNQGVEVMVDEKDPIYSTINVEFRGGSGQNAVTNIAIKLTRADGVVVQETLPARVGQTVKLQGTRSATDRLEVTVSLNNGQSYKIIDKLMYAQTHP